MAERFIDLSSLDKRQVIVLENSDPPAEVVDIVSIDVFTSLQCGARYGLLAALDR